MSEFELGGYIVRVKNFDTKRVLKIIYMDKDILECDDGMFYGKNPEWTRHATTKEIEQGYRDE